MTLEGRPSTIAQSIAIMEKQCLENWWIAFPNFAAYYSVQLCGKSTRNGAKENTSLTIDIRCYAQVRRDGQSIRPTWLHLDSVALLKRSVARLVIRC